MPEYVNNNANIGSAIAKILAQGKIPTSPVHIMRVEEGNGRKRWFFYKENPSNLGLAAAKAAVEAVGTIAQTLIGGTQVSAAASALRTAGNSTGQGSIADGNMVWTMVHKQYAKNISGNARDQMMWAKQAGDIQCFGFLDIIGQMQFAMNVTQAGDNTVWQHFLRTMESEPLADMRTNLSGTIMPGRKAFSLTGQSAVSYA